MEKLNTNHKEYRGNLAKDLKNVRNIKNILNKNEKEKVAFDLLSKAKSSEIYQESKIMHQKNEQKDVRDFSKLNKEQDELRKKILENQLKIDELKVKLDKIIDEDMDEYEYNDDYNNDLNDGYYDPNGDD